MNSEIPLVSVVVPAYNKARYIRHTLQSLVDQTYPKMEIIAVDDGSGDTTASLIQEMARMHPQIRLIRQRNSGVAAARNRGIAESRGAFIAPVDADDIWFPEAAAMLAACLVQSDHSVGVAYGWSIILDDAGMPDGGFCCSMIEGRVFNSLFAHNFIGNGSSTMIRRTCFEQVGLYDRKFRGESVEGCEDWDLYLRIAEAYQFRVVPKFIIGYRRVTDSLSANAASMAVSYAHLLRNVRQRHPGIPSVLPRLSMSGLYLYLAQEYHRRGVPSESYRWLRRALAAGQIYTLLRPGCYILAAKNSLAVFGKPSKQPGKSINPDACPTSAAIMPGGRENRIGDMTGQRVRIKVRILMQDILHRVVSRLPKF